MGNNESCPVCNCKIQYTNDKWKPTSGKTPGNIEITASYKNCKCKKINKVIIGFIRVLSISTGINHSNVSTNSQRFPFDNKEWIYCNKCDMSYPNGDIIEDTGFNSYCYEYEHCCKCKVVFDIVSEHHCCKCKKVFRSNYHNC